MTQMFLNLTAAVAREHVRDLRTIAERDRRIALTRRRAARA
jgi:hypothetical protein